MSLQVILNQVELTERQHTNIGDLCVSTVIDEKGISQSIDNMQQSLADSLVIYANKEAVDTTNYNTYITQMATAMGNIGAIETFFFQV